MTVNMLDTLRFVQGAVSTKEFVPALTHFQIADGRVTGYNGKLSISAPLQLDVDCCPKAVPFVNAVYACEDTAQLHLTDKRRLVIRSGKFRASIETLAEDTEYPTVVPEGERVQLGGDLLPVLAALYEITAEDASRPWAAGLLLDGHDAFATNNVVLVQKWLRYRFPYRVNVPRYAIKELLRIGEEPVSVQLTDTSITFHYEGDRWLRTQLSALDWPDAAGVLDKAMTTLDAPPVPEGLFHALEVLKPFLKEGNRIHFAEGSVHTARDDGASVELEGCPERGTYNARMLALLEPIATHIDFAAYPNPVPFFGDSLRGAIAGISAT